MSLFLPRFSGHVPAAVRVRKLATTPRIPSGRREGRHWISVISVWLHLADLKQDQAEGLHLSEHAVQCRLVPPTSEHGVQALLPWRHPRKRGKRHGAEMT